MIDPQTALQQIHHVSNAYRGHVQVLANLREQGVVGFEACIDLMNDGNFSANPYDAIGPLFNTIEQRLRTTNPEVMVEMVHAEGFPNHDGSRHNKLYIRVRLPVEEDY